MGFPPPYLPFDGDASRLKMGMRPLDMAEWTELDDDLEGDIVEKSRILEEHHSEVVAYIKDDRTFDACIELLLHLKAYLSREFPATYVFRDWWYLDGEEPITPVTPESMVQLGIHPVEVAGRLTSEDWCVMLPREPDAGDATAADAPRGDAPVGHALDGPTSDGPTQWELVAASVCFPTRWHMPSKIGGDLWSVHGPVAHYDSDLGRPVESFFSRITTQTPKLRFNWNLVDSPDMFQPEATNTFAETGPHPLSEVPDRVWLRVERQTLVKLPITGAVVFGIRVYVDPLSSLADSPEDLARLASSLRTMTPEAWQYKSLDGYGHEVLAWIDTITG